MSYVNKILDKSQTEHDIQDARVDALQTEVASKQDKLTAGNNITIESNVISASGGTKLYKHHLVFTSQTVELIATTAEPETGFIGGGGPPRSQVLNFDDIVSIYKSSNFVVAQPFYSGVKLVLEIYSPTNYTIDGTSFLGLTLSYLGTSSEAFVSDTVTPL